MRLAAGYFTPDEYYEALVAKLVSPETTWLDVGCGRHVFPCNHQLAELLADRCSKLVGLDPDKTIDDNAFVHERIRQSIENYSTGQEFHLITLRMVAEHIADPHSAVAALGRLTRPGGRVLVFTVSRWAATSIASRATPMVVHHAVKSALWRTEERDTFPVHYRLNTRARLNALFRAVGLREIFFQRLPDAGLFWRFRRLHAMELMFGRLMAALHLPHFDACLLGLYERA